MNEWVVTYRIDVPGGMIVAEFFRGDRDECKRIESQSSYGEHDQQRTEQPWHAAVGPAESWDAFVADGLASGVYVMAFQG